MDHPRPESQKRRRRASNGNAKPRASPPDILKRKNGINQKAASIVQAVKRSLRTRPMAWNVTARQRKEESREHLGEADGVQEPGCEPIDPLHAPGDIVTGVFAQPEPGVKGLVLPLLHPVDLLPNIIVDHKGIRQGLKMGRNKNDAREKHHQNRIEAQLPGISPLHHFAPEKRTLPMRPSRNRSSGFRTVIKTV